MEDLRGRYEHPQTGYELIVDTDADALCVSVVAPFRIVRMPGIGGHPSEFEFRSAHQNLSLEEAGELLAPLGFQRDPSNDRWTERGREFVSAWQLSHPDSDKLETVRRFLEACQTLRKQAA